MCLLLTIHLAEMLLLFLVVFQDPVEHYYGYTNNSQSSVIVGVIAATVGATTGCLA